MRGPCVDAVDGTPAAVGPSSGGNDAGIDPGCCRDCATARPGEARAAIAPAPDAAGEADEDAAPGPEAGEVRSAAARPPREAIGRPGEVPAPGTAPRPAGLPHERAEASAELALA